MGKISLVYARALAGAFGEQIEQLTAVADELKIVAKILAQPDPADFFVDPTIQLTQKIKTLETAFAQIQPEILNLLKLLVQNGRSDEIESIAVDFQKIAQRLAGQVSVRVESAAKLSEDLQKQLAAALQKMVGREVTLQVRENPALVCGTKIFVDDEEIDFCLASQLRKLRQNLEA